MKGIFVELLANSVDPDQTAPWEQSDLGLHYLLVYFCPNILSKHDKSRSED